MLKIAGNKFVVTGAAGFIGSHVVEELLMQDREVVCIDNFSNGSVGNVDIPVHDLDVSNCDQGKLDKLFQGVDVVFHEACSKCTVCLDAPLKDLMVNTRGSFKVFQAASKAGAKVIHASTGSVYGDCDIQKEDVQYAPKSFYGVSKLAAEQYLRCFPGLEWVVLRYFHVFGARQDSSDKGGVIPIFITKMLKNEPLTVFGDGEQTRSFTYVKDVVRANFMAANMARMNSRFYNVASGVKFTLNQLIHQIRTIIESTSDINHDNPRQGDIKYFNVNNKRLLELGMEFTPFGDGLQETVEYYAENG